MKRKCDRCGKEFDQHSIVIEAIKNGYRHYGKPFELCEDCQKEFEKFMGENYGNHKRRIYKGCS